MIDEFTAAHNLQYSVETGLLVLLVQRLIYQGVSKDVIKILVDASCEAHTAKTAPPPQEELPALGPDVLHFPRRPKT